MAFELPVYAQYFKLVQFTIHVSSVFTMIMYCSIVACNRVLMIISWRYPHIYSLPFQLSSSSMRSPHTAWEGWWWGCSSGSRVSSPHCRLSSFSSFPTHAGSRISQCRPQHRAVGSGTISSSLYWDWWHLYCMWQSPGGTRTGQEVTWNMIHTIDSV